MRILCQNMTRISGTATDKFLLHYAAARDKVDKEFETKFSRFRDIGRSMPSERKGLILAQYIGHKIFQENGLIHKYLNHSAIKECSEEERNYFKSMAGHPWRFSFSEISANPAPDFYEMEDVFTGEICLLYSPSTTKTLSENTILLWFNLIGFNGSCWQSYGPVIGYKSFSPDDIFFYATEFESTIESGVDLAKDIEDNPIRYMILAAGSQYPLVQSRGHEIVQVFGEDFSDEFEVQALKKEFKVEYSKSIFKLSHKIWSEAPHFAEAYYEETTGIVRLFALTDLGYEKVTGILHEYGIRISTEPEIRIHLPMLNMIELALKRGIVLNQWAKLFEKKWTAENDKEIKKINRFIALALPLINSGAKPDVEALSKEAGIDPELAIEVLRVAMEKIGEMRK